MVDLTTQLPSALQANASWRVLSDDRVPVMIVNPPDSSTPPPIVLWMHGRTVRKELDPGRYLRWMRAGIGACAIDLPGHGERYDPGLQHPDRTLDVVLRMINEIDGIMEALGDTGEFDMSRVGIGGMSAGGMATLARLCDNHRFSCASVEATTGSWRHQRQREMFRHRSDGEVDAFNPILRLGGWREIPLQAFHSRLDEWVDFDGQRTFLETVRGQYAAPELIEFVVYDETGAPYEHAGFGRHAADAKNRQRDFLAEHLDLAMN